MTLTPPILFGSNKTSPCVSQVYGISGSGKTFFLSEMLKKSRKSREFPPLWRAVVFDVKHDGYAHLVEKVAYDMEGFLKLIDKERLVVVHPDMEEAPGFLDEVIAWFFHTAQRVDKFAATLIIEESSTYIGSHAASIPLSIKRFATQGRSLGLSLILANQRSLSNKWTDTQSQRCILFRLAHPDRELLKKRWGIDPDELDGKLAERKFSFAHYDLESLTLDFYDPLPYPKTKPKKAA